MNAPDKEQFTYQGIHLASIRQINGLPDEARRALYCTLIPKRLLSKHCAAAQQIAPFKSQIRCPAHSGFAEIDIRHAADERDPLLYVQIADTANGQLEVLLLVVNDPLAPRFDVDRHWKGEYTKLDTLPRNIPAEVEAMNAGLAPGQVRAGLRLSRELIPVMETFAAGLAKDRFFIEPLAYHAAIIFERYGFAYMIGQSKMRAIHAGFQPGGDLFARLDASTPFRRPAFAQTVRGRSWAIHDGVLDEPWGNVRMYKRIGRQAGVCTFPNSVY